MKSRNLHKKMAFSSCHRITVAAVLFFLGFGIFSGNVIAATTGALGFELSGKDLFTGQVVEVSKTLLSKRGIVLVFLSGQCKTTRNHLSEIVKLSKSFTDFGFVGVHANLKESPLEARSFFSKTQFPFKVISDFDLAISDRFKVSKTPHVVVIGNNGKVLYKGGITSSVVPERAQIHFLEKALNEIITGQPVSIPEGRTLGCAIIRKGDMNVWK